MIHPSIHPSIHPQFQAAIPHTTMPQLNEKDLESGTPTTSNATLKSNMVKRDLPNQKPSLVHRHKTLFFLVTV